ncbi:hypothetical protein SAMN05192552_1004163 [Natrinema hispanicum]|uniref:Uncharacterized protein n=1 Tax=Natrinema hispanicum TaxID=392421 RepID=A0A1I0CDU4_9EURY|nr:hypothetical protein SAMN05192552_1004163 [Natrinema hispanicum]SET17750.1 hypothetical protein SAMN04488694_104139 [Natrinema hispanicum]
MSSWSPPTVPQKWFVGIGVLYGILSIYLFITQHTMTIIWLGFLLGVLYLSWRFVAAVEGIADALHRIAQEQEQN